MAYFDGPRGAGWVYGGTVQEPILESINALAGHTVSPGDEVITFIGDRTKKVERGIYVGKIREKQGSGFTEAYIIDRGPNKRRSRLQLLNFCRTDTKLLDLVGRYI